MIGCALLVMFAVGVYLGANWTRAAGHHPLKRGEILYYVLRVEPLVLSCPDCRQRFDTQADYDRHRATAQRKAVGP